jgi:hypothetical protein
MFLPLPQQKVLQKNKILVSEVLEVENFIVERRDNTKKNILNTGFIYFTTDSEQHS